MPEVVRDEGWIRPLTLCVDVASRVDEDGADAQMPATRRNPARRVPALRLSVDVGAQLEEELDDFDVAVRRCKEERAQSIVVRFVHVGSKFCE